jgi:hypothetical protein
VAREVVRLSDQDIKEFSPIRCANLLLSLGSALLGEVRNLLSDLA